ncbi:hypothetical protein ALC53_13558 [Atta colombica]|uniref:Uncharacterized protein n=1 Tax=Atta colombica TaxID=520822 RepID=A0A195AV04_9HYME|nr:hypothetical protein ALC53_13558 [Atta colombica]
MTSAMITDRRRQQQEEEGAGAPSRAGRNRRCTVSSRGPASSFQIAVSSTSFGFSRIHRALGNSTPSRDPHTAVPVCPRYGNPDESGKPDERKSSGVQ